MNMKIAETEKKMIERLMEDFYQLSLPDKMIASLCMESTADVEHWRLALDYPPNDPELPYNPSTGDIFSAHEMRCAINAILEKYRLEV
jgi:hypothetical protein